MKRKTIEIERWDMEEFIDTIVERVSEQISVNVNCEDLSPCLPCESEWLTTKEACDYFKVSQPTLKRLRERGEVEYKRIGKGFRYLRV